MIWKSPIGGEFPPWHPPWPLDSDLRCRRIAAVRPECPGDGGLLMKRDTLPRCSLQINMACPFYGESICQQKNNFVYEWLLFWGFLPLVCGVLSKCRALGRAPAQFVPRAPRLKLRSPSPSTTALHGDAERFPQRSSCYSPDRKKPIEHPPMCRGNSSWDMESESRG